MVSRRNPATKARVLMSAACQTPTLKYGRVRSRKRGTQVKFLCVPGWSLTGDKLAVCSNGTWDIPIPKCVRPTCSKKVLKPVNGYMLSTYNGAVVNFFCKQGYDIRGPSIVYCDGFNWDNHKPSCIPSQSKPKLFCDFEEDDLCNWTHDLNHHMDWVRDSYKTPTGYSMPTGPSFDHTKGNGSNGHYMYLESSSRRPNDTARLISPIFEKMDDNSTGTCLEFWYHMYGKTTGTLNAYIRNASEAWTLKPKNLLFTKSGDQGNVWYRSLTDLGVISEDFQIIMEGVRGNGYVSDIAIDDIRIIPNCNYVELLRSTTESTITVVTDDLIMGSCENRCGEVSASTPRSGFIACACDEFCYEGSRCCPDYIDICLTGSSVDWSTSSDEYPVTSEQPEDTTMLANRPTVSNVTRSVPPTSSTTPKYWKPAKSKPLVPQKPTLVFLQPTTTPKIIQKIIPSRTSAKFFVRPRKTTVKFYHDDVEVPTQASKPDDELVATDVESNDTNDINVQDKERYIEKTFNDKDYHIKITDEIAKHPEEYKTEFRQVLETGQNKNMVWFVIATVCVIALLVIVAVVALVKFRLIRRSRRIRSGQGQSQSDVRFLTSDEILDFSVDDHDYEDL